MNAALLLLRIVPGGLLVSHRLQKLMPRRFSAPLRHAMGPGPTASGFERLGIRPGLPAAILAGSAEVVGGFSLGAGLLTPAGTTLIGAVMTTPIVVLARNGIWNTEGGFEYPLVVLVVALVISALGPGSYSISAWAHVNKWPASTGR
jgi:putative oxidoreductase